MLKFFKFFKSRETKFVLATALSFLLIFSLMLSSISALTPMDGVYETTANATAVPDIVPVIDGPALARGEGPANLEDGLKEALTAVKLHFDIDEDIFVNFNWHYSHGDGYYSPDSWYLNWNSADWNASINANVTAGGILLGYSKYEWSDARSRNNIKLAEITKTKAKDIADAFLGKILGDEFSGFEMSSHWLGYPSDSHIISYVLTENGYKYPNYGLSVSVDKINGEIINYYRYGHQFFYDLSRDIFDYQNASSVITREKALESYLEHIGLDLVYASYYDWSARKLNIQPVYKIKNNHSEFISAVDGSPVTIDFNINPMYGDDMGGNVSMDRAREQAASGAPAPESVSFSNVELAAMAKAGDYITSDEAIAAMFEAFDVKIDLAEYQTYSNLRVDYINQDQYLWNINLNKQSDMYYEYYSAAVDARNGNIINYYTYAYDYSVILYDPETGRRIRGYEEPEFIYTYEEAKEMATAKIKELLPEGVDFDRDFEFTENRYQQIVPLAEPSRDDAPAKLQNYYFNFTRKANGILFENNSVSIGFDNAAGKINNYSLTWYEDAVFPALENIITPEKAAESIADFSGYSIIYMSNGMTDEGKINVSLIYRFDSPVNIDPFTGKPIGWNLDEITVSESAQPDYKDLGGHWSEKIVSTLAENGIYVWGGEEFAPDTGITRGEFFEYLKFYTNNYWSFTQLESSIFVNPQGYFRNIYNASAGPDSGKTITKQEAAKIICEIAGYGILGGQYEIFIYPFDDAACDDEYKGYISIIKTFGLINGDGAGNFNAKSDMTRAEAAAIVYNIIAAFNEVG